MATNEFSNGSYPPKAIDTATPHPARVYDYYLRGKDHYQVDQLAGEEVLAIHPDIRVDARANRAWLVRAVRWLAAEADIRQFLDIGPGLPTSPNTHEVAQAVHPTARVVYVDNDPIVLTHARALMPSGPAGATAYVDADLRDPEAILRHPDLLNILDLDRPVALLLVAVLHFLQDDDDPYGVVAALLDALPTGSFLALSHATGDFAPERWARIQQLYHDKGMPGQVRGEAEVRRFFNGLEMVPPGLKTVSRWRPDLQQSVSGPSEAAVSCYGAIARKS